MRREGVDKIFFAGTPLSEMVEYVHKHYSGPHKPFRGRKPSADMQLARKLTEIEDSYAGQKNVRHRRRSTTEIRKRRIRKVKVFGFTGPGGAGKTTLIDETCAAPSASRTESANRDSLA